MHSFGFETEKKPPKRSFAEPEKEWRINECTSSAKAFETGIEKKQRKYIH